jgi:hypothetical protein
MDGTQLFLKGLRWSYRRYGAKGVAGFLVLGVVGYLVFEGRLRELVAGEDAGGDGGDSTDEAGGGTGGESPA